MFYDEVKVSLSAGNGGDGCFSFRRAKYQPKGGPDGGNGGKGGSIVLLGDNNVSDLTDFYFKPIWKARNGEPGRGSSQNGAKGEDLFLRVPVGTVIYDKETNEVLAEILDNDSQLLLLEGGDGGKGNKEFKSSTNQAPREYTLGKEGNKGDFFFIIKTIADIGLVGFPNAGKSTLLSKFTNAHPKIGDYPFTTLFPTVGILDYLEKYERITIADIPGIIEGASQNKGLGHRFLKHIERCKVIILLLDMQGTDDREPLGDYRILINELKLYKNSLIKKPIIVVGNKTEGNKANDNFVKIRKKIKEPFIKISCKENIGLSALKSLLWDTFKEITK